MKCLVVLVAVVGAAVGTHWGLPQPVHDTPEVAHAKAEHLAAVAAAKHGVHLIPHPAPHHYHDAPQKKWTGPLAYSPGYDKHGAPLPVLDTPEVSAEKAKHHHLFAHGAHAAAAAAVGHHAPAHVTYHTQAAPAYHSHGAYHAYNADTPEVAAAKAEHFAAHAAAYHY